MRVDVTSQPPPPAFGPLRRHPAVRALLAACGEADCHLVGGALRDHALGLGGGPGERESIGTHQVPSRRRAWDLDAVVAGHGREIAERLAAALPARLVPLGGKEFAAYRLVGAEVTVDLWDREGAPLASDLARRDFTVNSFALEPRGGALIDPFGGIADLARRVLRATTPASFASDPLRVLRLARLLATLPGFTAEPATLELARQAAPRLSEVASERVREELWLLFDHPRAHLGLRALAALGLYPRLWLGAGAPQSIPGSPRPTAETVLPDSSCPAEEGAAAEIEAVPDCAAELAGLAPAAAGEIDATAARLAASFAHLPATAGGPAAALRRWAEAGYVTAKVLAEVAPLLDEEALPAGEATRRHFLHRAGRRWATIVCSLGARAAAAGEPGRQRWRRDVAPLVELARREGENLFHPPRLLTGSEVQDLLGIPPGPEIGRALAALTAAQVEGRVHTREEAIELLTRRAHQQG
jgi:poly(A) polymerase